MKKIFVALFSVSVLLGACTGKSGDAGQTRNADGNDGKDGEKKENVSVPFPKEIDYKMLSNEADLKKVYGMILTKLGDNAKAVDKIYISVRRPSSEGTIIRKDEPDNLNLDITYLYPEDKKKLYNVNYYSGNKDWDEGSVKTVQLIGGNAENFRLENEMFDLTPLTPDILCQIVKDAMAKYKDDSKYSYQYIKNITINKKNGVDVSVFGKLSANDLDKSNYYQATLTGKKR
ncbi:MAG: hypothetical protein FWF54_10805 [Candidatus Azobacteroides sp.]|nr:hypothetical protein [Candidatus Azobacteroides sp.]